MADLGAVVLDVGSHTLKAGYAADDHPKTKVPCRAGVIYTTGSLSTVGTSLRCVSEDMAVDTPAPSKHERVIYVGSESLALRRDHMEVCSPMSRGLITDFELMQQLWEHTLTRRMHLDTSLTPLLLTEAAFNTPQLRAKATEILFERFQLPALFVAKQAVLSNFAFLAERKTTSGASLVVDCGHGITSVVPVHEGYTVTHAMRWSHVAGELLTQELAHELNRRNVPIHPEYSINKKEVSPGNFKVTIERPPHTHQSYHEYTVNKLVEDIKATHARVSQQRMADFDNSHIPYVYYDLPDNSSAPIGIERFRVPEILFDPSTPSKSSDLTGVASLQAMIMESIHACKDQIQRDLLNNIIVVGGSSLFEGFMIRLKLEIETEYHSYRFPSTMPRPKVAQVARAERRYGAWLGGSLLASMPSHQSIWISQAEYQECGSGIANRKCP